MRVGRGGHRRSFMRGFHAGMQFNRRRGRRRGRHNRHNKMEQFKNLMQKLANLFKTLGKGKHGRGRNRQMLNDMAGLLESIQQMAFR